MAEERKLKIRVKLQTPSGVTGSQPAQIRPVEPQEGDLRPTGWRPAPGLYVLIGALALGTVLYFSLRENADQGPGSRQAVSTPEPTTRPTQTLAATAQANQPPATPRASLGAPADQPGGREKISPETEIRPQETAIATETPASPEPNVQATEPSTIEETTTRPVDQLPDATVVTEETAVETPSAATVTEAAPVLSSDAVSRAQFTNGVRSGEPIDDVGSVVYRDGDGAKRLYYFTEVRDMKGQLVTHRWEYNGQMVAQIPFEIRGDRWRIYSNKRLGRSMTGDWRVVVADSDGAILHEDRFEYR